MSESLDREPIAFGQQNYTEDFALIQGMDNLPEQSTKFSVFWGQ